MTSATRSLFSRLTAPTIAASLPLVIWARDNIAGLVRVKGPSMEPTLQEGDVVWVRKADGGLLPRFFRSLVFGSDRDDDDDDAMIHPSQQQQMMAHQPEETSMARLYQRPPQVQRGQVVVLKSVDTAFPDEWHIKRVWGTPGTWVKVENGALAGDRRAYRKLQAVPSYSLYVGGDNEYCSRDSRQYGPVSQNLLVGVAEYVVWPPSRIQKVRADILSDHSVPNKEMNFPNAPRA